jgi:hypothetical protein
MARRFLSFNQFNGTIPPTIMQLTTLRELYVIVLFPQYWLSLMYRHLASNRMTGTLPVFGELVSLEQLYVVV